MNLRVQLLKDLDQARLADDQYDAPGAKEECEKIEQLINLLDTIYNAKSQVCPISMANGKTVIAVPVDIWAFIVSKVE